MDQKEVCCCGLDWINLDEGLSPVWRYCVNGNESSDIMIGKTFLGKLRNNKFSIETQHDWVVVENQLVKFVTLVRYCFANSKLQVFIPDNVLEHSVLGTLRARRMIISTFSRSFPLRPTPLPTHPPSRFKSSVTTC